MKEQLEEDGMPKREICEQDPLRKLHGKRVIVRGFDRATGEYVEEAGTLMLPWALPDDIDPSDFDDDAA